MQTHDSFFCRIDMRKSIDMTCSALAHNTDLLTRGRRDFDVFLIYYKTSYLETITNAFKVNESYL